MPIDTVSTTLLRNAENMGEKMKIQNNFKMLSPHCGPISAQKQKIRSLKSSVMTGQLTGSLIILLQNSGR